MLSISQFPKDSLNIHINPNKCKLLELHFTDDKTEALRGYVLAQSHSVTDEAEIEIPKKESSF